MNAQRAFVLAVLSIAAWSWLSNRKAQPKGKAMAMGSAGLAPGVVLKVQPAKRPGFVARSRSRAWASLRGHLILAAHRWPVQVGSLVLALSLGWFVVLVQAVVWRFALVLVSPFVVLGAVVLARRFRPAPEQWASTWAVALSQETVGPDGKPKRAVLPGSRVVGRVVKEQADGMLKRVGLMVQGWDAAQSATSITAQREAIAAAYRVPLECVAMERAEDHARAMVWITTAQWLARQERIRADRLAQVHVLAHTAGFRDGSVDVSVQVASGEPGLYRIYTRDVGAHHGQLVGRTRSGKSEGAHTLYKVACSSGLVVPHIADLAGGVSLQWWEDRAASYATNVADTKALIRALDREYDARILYMRREGLRVLNPSGDWPHHRLFVDEAPELAQDKEAMALIGKALRMWAKANMAVDWASQAGHVSQAWGKDTGTALSEQMANLWAFGAGRQTSNIVMHGTELDLGQIPRGVPGASFLMSPDHPEPVLVRARYDAKPDPRWLSIPAFRWPEEPILSSPTLAPERPLSTVLDLDPTERVRNALSAGPLTIADIAKATRLNYQKVERLLRSIPDAVGDGAKYGQKWSLS